MKIKNNKLKKIRNKKGISLRGLSYKSGVSLTTVRNAEQHDRDIQLSTAYSISEALDLNVYEIWEIK